MQVEIYGYSDDNIVVKGYPLDEEYGAYLPIFLGFSDGTQIKCEYSPDGYSSKWKIERTKEGSASYSHSPAPGGLDQEDQEYSDRVTLNGDLKWVDCWKHPTPDCVELRNWAENFNWTSLFIPELEAIRNIALRR